MIQTKVLEGFKDYLESGRFEEDFSYSSEERRGEMLETLELFMDVSDIAEDIATRLIFKGLRISNASDNDIK